MSSGWSSSGIARLFSSSAESIPSNGEGPAGSGPTPGRRIEGGLDRLGRTAQRIAPRADRDVRRDPDLVDDDLLVAVKTSRIATPMPAPERQP